MPGKLWIKSACSVSVFDGTLVSNKQVPKRPPRDAQIALGAFLIDITILINNIYYGIMIK